MAHLIPDAALEPTISVDRAASILGVHKRTLYFAIERHEFPAIRVGKCVRVPTARFLAEYPDLTAAT
jgi:excisionase family DNA binding protein